MKKYISEFGGTPVKDNTEPTPTDVAWLAGIFDGEGSILLNKNGNSSPYVGFHITNSSSSLLLKAKSILESLLKREVKLYRKKVYPKAIVATKLEIFTIDFRNQKDVYTALTSLMPHLTAKKPKAEIVLKYIAVRLEERKDPKLSNKLSESSRRLLRELISGWRGVETERDAPGNRVKLQSELCSNAKS